MDFTLKTYRSLLQALKDAGYRFVTFEEYIKEKNPNLEILNPKQSKGEFSEANNTGSTLRSPVSGLRSPFVILRHDVDLLPRNSLAFARIQHEMGIVGSYYFRAVPESWDEEIIKEIHSLGHEVGYHYEDMDLIARKMENRKWKMEKTAETQRRRDDFKEIKEKEKTKTEQSHSNEKSGLQSPHTPYPIPQTPHPSHSDLAIKSFQRNLEQLRQLVPVKTICMHGSPRSRYDNRDLWKKYDYRDYGIIGEPYFDVDFNEMFYLTDTGRRWDGWRVSIRDKIPQQQEWIRQGLVFRSTREIIQRVKHKDFPASEGSGNVRKALPTQIMMTFHPQRWTDEPLPWVKELVMQKAKNVVKYLMNLRSRNGQDV
jgi:hypothetical protein